MQAVLDHLLRRDPAPSPLGSLDDWWRQHQALAELFAHSADLALVAGFAADRLGYAFGSGYQAAGCALFPPMTGQRPGALCATEGGSARPRDIHTTLDRKDDGTLSLSGRKSFVTLGDYAELLLVVASEGKDESGRNRLRVVAIDKRPGVSVIPIDDVPFVPEIPHAALELDAVTVKPDEVLPGDGYDRYLKPFRTVEDIHVHAALLGWLLQIARRSDWPTAVTQQLVASAVTIRTLASADPSAPTTHVALGGALAQARTALDACEPYWPRVDDDTRLRWERDRPLLKVAGKARHKRLETAWGMLAQAWP